MFCLRVVACLLSCLVLAGAQEGKIECVSRAPPDVDVVPYKPQPPPKYVKCEPSNQSCYYFRYHGTRTSRDFPVHGCAHFEKLPPGCKGGATFYEPNWKLSYRGVKYEGSIKCCGNDFCNEIEEAMFVPVHIDHDDATYFKIYFLYPILLTLFIGLVFIDYLPDFMYKIRTLLHLEKDEQSDCTMQAALEMNPAKSPVFPSNGEVTVKEYTGPNVTGFFWSIHSMLEAIREIEKWRPIDSYLEKERRGRIGRRRHGRDLYKKEFQINSHICNLQASQHEDAKVFREVPTRLTDLLARLIEHGPYQFPHDPNELGDLFEKASEVLAEEPSVVDIDLGVHIIGNLEGSYINLFRWFSICGWPPKEKFVFLGGAIHPTNPYSLEVIALLLALKVKMPSQVYLIRGSAEGQPLNMEDRFPPRVTEALREVAVKALNRLPIAVLINKQILCIHSALPNKISSILELNQVRRPLVKYHKESLEAYLFNAIPDDILSKPIDDLNNGENPLAYVDDAINGFMRKGSLLFLPRDLDDTAKKLKLDLIIRAKSVCRFGISALADHVISLWSAHSIGAAVAGAVINVDHNGIINTTRIYKHQTFNDERTDVCASFLENTLADNLERIDRKKKQTLELDNLHLREPIKERMGYHI
ncbi:hypothetical protein PENTCL1PPCAC_18174 [Pristionchus entomophagus]|uniref:Serine/threonine specific protein phosphatases domain-containing protein n=1 Tax=Pristionchus entomophagus TaxID=358040 RepID=A0AAV5TNP4_9BILA|nr:hypothetical protein PENTCL1PPCAC_18174 [Pristionchus entomophagus]